MSSHPCDTKKVAFQDRLLPIGGPFLYKMAFWGMTKWPTIGHVGGWLLIRVAAHIPLLYTDIQVMKIINETFYDRNETQTTLTDLTNTSKHFIMKKHSQETPITQINIKNGSKSAILYLIELKIFRAYSSLQLLILFFSTR